MRSQIILLSFLFLSALPAIAQQIPEGSCGIINVYDAAGNRTKRMYFCNNEATPYPQGKIVAQEKSEIAEFQEIDALFPNPTTGKFYITFSKALENAMVTIIDVSGRVVNQIKAIGTRIEFDLSTRPSGVYYIHIAENGKLITKKVLKQ